MEMSIVTTTEMFKKAYKEGYAIGAFNVNNMEIIQGIMEAAGELRSPVILQVSNGARKYAGHNYIVKLVEAATMQYKDIPVALSPFSLNCKRITPFGVSLSTVTLFPSSRVTCSAGNSSVNAVTSERTSMPCSPNR